MKILIDSGADLNVQLQPIPGSTALVLAVAKNHKEIVEMLIKSGANLNIRNRNGKTALDIMKDKEMMKYKDKQKIKKVEKIKGGRHKKSKKKYTIRRSLRRKTRKRRKRRTNIISKRKK